MRIFDELLNFVPEDAMLTDLVVGVHWVLAQSQYGYGRAATAYGWSEQRARGNTVEGAGTLVGRRIRDLAHLYDSESWTARAVALAALSSALPAPDLAKSEDVSAQDYICRFSRQNPNALIAVIGHFRFVEPLREEGVKLSVFELSHRCNEGDIAHTEMSKILPKADLLVMTASTLITHSCEEVLSYCGGQCQSLLVGPTAPIHRSLAKFGINAVCSSVVGSVEETRRVLIEGGGHRQFPETKKFMLWLT
ncbi:MAG: DUF364 domain-containing protein [Thiopseudomonas sp.]|nr:DUF364 domain-containing protein [Thiopseudomonas sp.]